MNPPTRDELEAYLHRAECAGRDAVTAWCREVLEAQLLSWERVEKLKKDAVSALLG